METNEWKAMEQLLATEKINQRGVYNINRNNGSGVYMPEEDTLKMDWSSLKIHYSIYYFYDV
jgi:hypothetical protein